MSVTWKGVFPAVTTQFKKDQSLDLEATARHIGTLIESGVQGLVMLGSLGENAALEPEEKRRVMEVAIKTAGERVPVLSGISECSTAAACAASDPPKSRTRNITRSGCRMYASPALSTCPACRSTATRIAISNINTPASFNKETQSQPAPAPSHSPPHCLIASLPHCLSALVPQCLSASVP